MAITNAPVDQARFTTILFMGCEPKMKATFDPVTNKRQTTGEQDTSKDGLYRKWTVQAAVSKPSTFDPSRTDSEVLAVTVTSAEDPAEGLMPGTPILFENFVTGVMAPEAGDNGKIRGGKLFWQASGVRAMVGSKS